ncbi:POK6 protein, partial [Certhia familiaris]|nr:POK6 protein [Certhia familiaris]
MGALQPGLPNAAMLPGDWHLLVIDLKDCFFTIRADKLVSVVHHTPISAQSLAQEVHAVFHQNAKGLHKEFKIPIVEAQAIIKACPICSHHNQGLGLGIGV